MAEKRINCGDGVDRRLEAGQETEEKKELSEDKGFIRIQKELIIYNVAKERLPCGTYSLYEKSRRPLCDGLRQRAKAGWYGASDNHG